MTTGISIFSSGYCTANNRIVHPEQRSGKIRFYATWALIEHPSLGRIVFDSGYSNGFFTATRSLPSRLYRWVTPVTFKEEQSCLNQLKRVNLEPEDISHLVTSHFHADHIGGLKDFPKVTYWCSEQALDHALDKTNLNGVFRGILPPLIPRDIKNRSRFPEKEFPPVNLAPFNSWKWAEDVYFIDLPGHARGQIGLLVRNTSIGDVFLCADGAWTRRSVEERIYPAPVIKVFVDNYRILRQTIDKLNQFHTNNPEVLILPAHCPETVKLITKPADIEI